MRPTGGDSVSFPSALPPHRWTGQSRAVSPGLGIITLTCQLEDARPRADQRRAALGAHTGAVKTYTLLDEDGRPYQSDTPGTLGGYRPRKIYGRLDCPSALRAIATGQYVQHRVFFADEDVAIVAGYRPCGHCLRSTYREWLADEESRKVASSGIEPSGRD